MMVFIVGLGLVALAYLASSKPAATPPATPPASPPVVTGTRSRAIVFDESASPTVVSGVDPTQATIKARRLKDGLRVVRTDPQGQDDQRSLTRAFQTEAHLAADGIYGPRTAGALYYWLTRGPNPAEVSDFPFPYTTSKALVRYVERVE